MPTQLATLSTFTPISLSATFSEKPHMFVGTTCGIEWTGVIVERSRFESGKDATADDTAETTSEWQVSRQGSDHLWTK
jgi:hypothetical protein